MAKNHPIETPRPTDIDAFLTHLILKGAISQEATRRYHAADRASLLSFDQIVVELGLLREADLVKYLSDFLDLPATNFAEIEIDSELSSQLGFTFCEEWGLLPANEHDGVVLVLSANPFDIQHLEMVAYFFDRPIAIELCLRSELVEFVSGQKDLTRDGDSASDMPDQGLFEGDAARLKDLALDAPVVTFVARIAQEAMDAKVSDIHIEPFEDGLHIRFRHDGMLRLHEIAPRSMLTGVITRIKILAHMNIVERRKPQDGRTRLSIRGEEVDFRVSVMPTIHGESVVMRLLVGRMDTLDLGRLGYDEDAIAKLTHLSSSSNGIVAITGPTGSGKTTTLYSLVSRLDRKCMKIFTIEDPVEYRLEGITQLQIDAAIGLDFPTALRSVLRQDPDVILIGEIRDRETAQIAVQAALTGHLVLTTLHTNSAAGALTRLRDMGIEPFLIGATMRGTIAQRLVRRVCQACGGGAKECNVCLRTGTSGRTVVYEVLEVTSSIGELITAGQSEAAIEQRAISDGMNSLRAHGEKLAANGVVSSHEIARVLSGDG